MYQKVIYPGTFDPITNGHLNILKRSIKIFKKVILAISKNSNKNTLFSLKERIKIAKEATRNIHNVKIMGFNNLTIDFAKQKKAMIIIRGIRSIIDCEYELHNANMNFNLEPKLESIFFISQPKYLFISSSRIKEIAKYNGSIKKFLPSSSYYALKKKIKKK